jgi:hypothetical protein
MLAVSTAALALMAIGASALTAVPASAAPARTAAGSDLTLGLSPKSGSNFSSDHATLSWSALPAACIGQEVDAFIYKGTGLWDSDAINVAEGNPPNGSGQQTYFNFFSNGSAASGTTSTSWPNVSGYQDWGFATGNVFANTAALVAAQGTGTYTIGVACVSSTTFAPITDTGGNPIAGSILLNVGATGNSWGILAAASTAISMTGTGTAKVSGSGTVNLTATVTATGGSTPAGGVNFYANGTGTGTPLNGSTPVAVGSGGKAQFSGSAGYAGGVIGAQSYTAKFVPTDSSVFTGSTVTGAVNLILDNVTIKVTAKQDQKVPTSADVTATGTGSPLSKLSTLVQGIGVELKVDGKIIEVNNGQGATPVDFSFNSSNVASGKITKLKPGAHTFPAVLADAPNGKFGPVGPAEGFTSTATTAKLTLKKGTLKAATPKITGTPKVGDTLKVSTGSWTPGTKFTFQWLANGKSISKATKSSLKLTSAQKGKKISVRVTGSKTGFNSVTKTSAPTGAVKA